MHIDRQMIHDAIETLDMVAGWSDTKIDDHAVDLLRALEGDDAVVAAAIEIAKDLGWQAGEPFPVIQADHPKLLAAIEKSEATKEAGKRLAVRMAAAPGAKAIDIGSIIAIASAVAQYIPQLMDFISRIRKPKPKPTT